MASKEHFNLLGASLRRGHIPFFRSNKAAPAPPGFQGTADFAKQMEWATQDSMRYQNPAYAKKQLLLSRTEPGGLFNIGLTCWMNSLIQTVLKRTPIYYDKIKELAEQEENPNPIAATLLNIFNFSDETPVTSEVNKKLMDELETLRDMLAGIDPELSRGQHDPKDALRIILGPKGLDLIPDHDDPRISSISRKTYLRAVMSEHNSYSATASTTQITFSSHGIKSIQEGFDKEFMTSSVLTDQEMPYFGNLTEAVMAHKIEYFTDDSIPEQMVVQAPRFENRHVQKMTQRGLKWVNEGKKNTKDITFDETIEIPLYSEDGQRLTKIIKMKLQSVVGHSGSLNGGHYVAYQKNADETYTFFNDSAEPAKLTKAEAQEKFKKQGYLAVYALETVQDIPEGTASKYKTLNDSEVCPPPLRTDSPGPFVPDLSPEIDAFAELTASSPTSQYDTPPVTPSAADKNASSDVFVFPDVSPPSSPPPKKATTLFSAHVEPESKAKVFTAPAPRRRLPSTYSTHSSDGWEIVEAPKTEIMADLELSLLALGGRHARSTLPKSRRWHELNSSKKKFSRFADA